MESLLVMVSDVVWGKLSNEQLDAALKTLHGHMTSHAPQPLDRDYGVVPTWDVNVAEHQLRGFLELEAGPKGEHVVTLFDPADVELMGKAPANRLQGPGLRQIVWLHTRN